MKSATIHLKPQSDFQCAREPPFFNLSYSTRGAWWYRVHHGWMITSARHAYKCERFVSKSFSLGGTKHKMSTLEVVSSFCISLPEIRLLTVFHRLAPSTSDAFNGHIVDDARLVCLCSPYPMLTTGSMIWPHPVCLLPVTGHLPGFPYSKWALVTDWFFSLQLTWEGWFFRGYLNRNRIWSSTVPTVG